MSKIFTVVRNIVAERSGITPKSLEGCTNLEAVGLDGMDMSELIMAIEDEFALEIADDVAEKIHTVGDAIKFVSEHPFSK